MSSGFGPFLLAKAGHPRQAVLTAAALTLCAALDHRPGREVGLVFATVLVGQLILGWHNDLVDERADRDHQRAGKPIAQGRIEAGTVWFWLCVAVLVVVPLAVTNGVRAGIAYLASVAIGMVGNVAPRRGLLSFLPWALAFALYPFFLSYGGWGGQAHGDPPQWVLVGLSAALGVWVHVLLALWGLVADNEDGWTYLPLRLGLRMGATRLLLATGLLAVVTVAAIAYEAHRLGLSR
jgi:4-hydroxybenzoate polyprenyltransferase